MLTESCDTNILLYGMNRNCPEYAAASGYLERKRSDDEFALCALTLVELYVLLRNPAAVSLPVNGRTAVSMIQTFVDYGQWRVIDYPGGLLDDIWTYAAMEDVARRRIYDIRLAVTLRHFGMRRFATRNVKDFQGFGFDEVFDPIAAS